VGFPSRILPSEGGRIRTSIPQPRSESAGGAARSPKWDPPHRRGQTRESGDAGGRATPDRQPLAVAAIGGKPTQHPGKDAEFTMVPEVESLTRGSDTSPPTSARRDSADNDASLSTMQTSGADFQTQYVATHTNVTDLTSTKQSAPGPFQAARAGIVQTKDRQLDLKVDSAVQSTYLQSGVTVSSQLRPAETQMAPHRTSEKGPQTLLGATAQFVASSSPTPSQRTTFSMRPPHVHRVLPHRSAFSATAFLAGREVNDEAKTRSMATTTCGNVVSQECKSVSDAQHLVRRSSRDTPSSTLSSTDGEVAYLTGTMASSSELDMGPFLLTQSNPIHQLMDPIQSNP